MGGPLEVLAEADRLRTHFEALGAERVETDILQPADVLLDLYGEDIRGRAFVTQDPLRGEAMLRPDFTVPVVRIHLETGRDEARYTYSGKIFRQQPGGDDRPSEYAQVGYERFGGADPAEADADVFVAFRDLLAPYGLRAATGDMGLLRAAVSGLGTSPARRAALARHLWRPRRFRTLLRQFSAPVAPRTAEPIPDAPEIGLRGADEIEARLAALAEDAATPPIGAGELAALDELLSLRMPARAALARVRDLAVDMGSLRPAVGRLAHRLEALEARGVDTDALDFEASYGRTHMEYYDGFVFGFYAEGRPDLPPVATGGRYDALTRQLGGSAPAVGGVIRPAVLLALGERP